jgi:hypothetical protein
MGVDAQRHAAIVECVFEDHGQDLQGNGAKSSSKKS